MRIPTATRVMFLAGLIGAVLAPIARGGHGAPPISLTITRHSEAESSGPDRAAISAATLELNDARAAMYQVAQSLRRGFEATTEWTGAIENAKQARIEYQAIANAALLPARAMPDYV